MPTGPAAPLAPPLAASVVGPAAAPASADAASLPRLRLLTWNVQWCRGIDGRVDPQRIIDSAFAFAGGELDVLCLQEVARHHPDLPGSAGEDQFALLQAACPGFEAVEAIGTDVRSADGRRRQFGNLLLSRRPILQARRHQLPWTGDPTRPSMPRAVAEAVIDTAIGPLAILTTHLEYYSLPQRQAQVEALRRLHAETVAREHDRHRPRHAGSPFEQAPHARATLICGDFNLRPADPEYAALMAPIDGVGRLQDAWVLAHPGQAHPPTLGLHDPTAGTEPAYCCDFVLVSENLVPQVQALDVDLQTQASDHQPLLLALRC